MSLDIAPSNAAELVSELYGKLRDRPADGAAWLELARLYVAHEQWPQACYAGTQARRCDVNLSASAEALLRNAPSSSLESVLRGARGSDLAAQRERLVRQVAALPQDWLSCLYLARIHELSGDAEGAFQALCAAIAVEPLTGESVHWLGSWRLAAGDSAGAVHALRTLIDVRPHASRLHDGIGLGPTGRG